MYLPAKAFSNKHRQKLLLPEPAKRASNRLFQPTRIATSTDRLLIGMPEMRLKLGDFKNGMASFLKPTWNNKWIEKMNCIQKLKVPALLRLGHSKAHVLAAYVSHSLLPLTLAEDSYGYPPSTCQPTMAACINMYTYINTYIHICIYAYEYLYLAHIYI